MASIFHIAETSGWTEAQGSGFYRRSTLGKTLEEEGFIHCCYEQQLQDVVNELYEGHRDLLLLVVDPAKVDAEIREEAVGDGAVCFPHIYGPLNLSAVSDVRPFPIDVPTVDIRFACRADALDVAGVHVRSWQAAYQGLLPAEYLSGLSAEDRASHYTFEDPAGPTTLLALDAGVILGFATVGASRDEDAGHAGELMALYVDPPAWGQGVGRSLMEAARLTLIDKGFRDVLLWVLVGNDRAERFYRLDGWTSDGSQRQDQMWGVEVSESRYRRGLP